MPVPAGNDMARVHQFVPTFEPGAVGGHILTARRVLREAGYESEIFAGDVHPAFAGEGAFGAAGGGGAGFGTMFVAFVDGPGAAVR